MPRLRRTGSGDLVTPHLAMDVQSMYKMWSHQLIPPGTSSLGTAYFSTLLARVFHVLHGCRNANRLTSRKRGHRPVGCNMAGM